MVARTKILGANFFITSGPRVYCIETAGFVLSIKKPLFAAISLRTSEDPSQLTEELWEASELIDRLSLFTVNAYLKGREQVIRRQQEELLELSTPVVKVWDGILALPMIGTLDSARTQVVMESLLQRIVETDRNWPSSILLEFLRRYLGCSTSTKDHHGNTIDGSRMHC